VRVLLSVVIGWTGRSIDGLSDWVKSESETRLPSWGTFSRTDGPGSGTQTVGFPAAVEIPSSPG